MSLRRKSSGAPTHQRRGFILVVVLVLVFAVAFAGFAFVELMSNEYRAVHINGDLLEAEQLLASADVMLRQFINLSREQRSQLGGWQNNLELFQEQILQPMLDDDAEMDPLTWRFSVVSPFIDSQTTVETSGVRFGLENESARLNLGNLLNLDLMTPQGGRLALMQLPGMTEIAADSIMDWIDADDVPREFGAESEFYWELPNPYRPRNGLPTTLEELLLVQGVHRSLLFGLDRNRNFRIDDNERPTEAQPERLLSQDSDSEQNGTGWADVVTLHSAERNVDRFGNPRINLNLPDLRQLQAALSEVLSSEVTEFIIHWRQFGPAPVESISAAPGVALDLSLPAKFDFQTVADIIDARTFAATTPTAVVVPSPLVTSSHEEIALLLDHTTVRTEAILRNRINVNLAPLSVLRTLPHIEEEQANQILSRRDTLDAEAMSTPAWLLSEQVLSLETFKAVLPFVTTGGDVFRAQVVAWRAVGGPYRRVEFLFDGATDHVGRIRWKDLSAFGVGFPMESLASNESTSALTATEIER